VLLSLVYWFVLFDSSTDRSKKDPSKTLLLYPNLLLL
jgi:hypothetical protein